MLDESLRRRLEALNRERLPFASSPRTVAVAPSLTPPQPAVQAVSMCDLLGRGHEVTTQFGNHWRIRIAVDELWPLSSQLVEGRCRMLKLPDTQVNHSWKELVSALPARTVALDLETCGLGGAALFLAGLLREIEGTLCVELLLARNYAEEAAVLATMWQVLGDADALLTFNGKSFDWPTVVDRSRRWLLDRELTLPAPTHFDLLHPARRRWRKLLPNCRLLTLERHICRRSRKGDIEGREIPAAYDRFVRSGDPEHIEPILYHNALDLVTLFDLTLRLID